LRSKPCAAAPLETSTVSKHESAAHALRMMLLDMALSS
jgi:hypothetical protein